MARLWQSGAELNSTTTDVEVSTNSGTISISSTTVRSGTYAWRANPSAGTGFYRQVIFATDQSIKGLFRVYLNIASLPGATTRLLSFATAANAPLARIDITSGGLLQLRNSNNVQVGSNSSALNTGQWYMIDLVLDASSNPGSLEGRIDGTSFASGANSSQGSWSRILWGAITTVTCDFFFDDAAMNDTSGSFQNSYPGSGKIIHLRPSAAGDANGFTTQTGGTAGAANNYTRVDEVTPDDATTFNGASLLNLEDLYNVDNSGIGSGDTVNVVMVGGRFRNNVADATSQVKFEVEKTSGGTKTQSATIVPNSTTWRTNAIAAPFNYPITTYQDPDSAAWTQSTLDSMQIGMIMGLIGVNRVDVTMVWACVDYTPSSSTTTPQTVTGKARIQKTVVRTATGVARILVTVARTVTGKARITKTVPQTITGRSRLTVTTVRTTAGKARITAVTTRTILGVARVTTTVLRTIVGRARIRTTVPQIITGVSRVTATATKNIPGKARLTVTTGRTIDGKSRMQQTTPRTITGIARLVGAAIRTILGISRILRAVAHTISGIARIAELSQQAVTGRARVQVASTRTVAGVARIVQNVNVPPIGIVLNDSKPGGVLSSGSDLAMVLSGGPNDRILDDGTTGTLNVASAAIIENRVT